MYIGDSISNNLDCFVAIHFVLQHGRIITMNIIGTNIESITCASAGNNTILILIISRYLIIT
jgi:hypothetical protein